MNRYLRILAISCALIAAASCSALATPSFRGYTGLIKIPTADSLFKEQWNVGVMTENVGDFNANDIFANYGIADNLEVGFNAFQPAGAIVFGHNHEEHFDDDTARLTWINAKYTFMQETCTKPGVAVGIIDITNSVDTTPYVVLSKSFGGGLTIFHGDITNFRGHIGLAGGQMNGVFVGLSGFVGTSVELMFEWDSHDPNIGARFTLIPGLKLHAAWFDAFGSGDFGLGASYQRSF